MVAHSTYADVSSHSLPSDLVLVGGGPRSIIQANSEIIFMLLYRRHFDELSNLGAHYDISSTIIESQHAFGVGHSYNNGQTGMMNTGIEGDITFPVPVPEENSDKKPLMSLLSYRNRLERFISGNLEQYFKYLKAVNLPGAVMFKNSVGPSSCTRSGKIEHQRAYLLRSTVGEEESMTTTALFNIARATIPFYKLKVLTSSKARGVLLNEHERPVVNVENMANGRVRQIEGDSIRLNCGTTTKNPVNSDSVRGLTFCESMNALHFRNYCARRDMLGADGYLKSGVKIISGGMGLSALDQLSVLDHVMNLFEEDNSALGYRVREEAKKKYKSSITLISRTAANACVPRHTFTAAWQQGTPILGGAKHLHALFLHNFGEEVYGIWMTLIKSAVARARGITAKEAECIYASTEDQLRAQFQESTHFMKSRQRAGKLEKLGDMVGKQEALKMSSRTVYGAWRQAALGTFFGLGLQSHIDEAIEEMRSFAPITWKGREFWLFVRGQIASMTDPKFALKTSNQMHLKNWNSLIKHVTSSPVEIHSMMHLLVDAGVAKYEQASYSDIAYDALKNKLQLHGNSYDMLIVSPTFDRMKDEAAVSAARQFKSFDQAHGGAFGQCGKLRRFVDSRNKCVPVEDYGLRGRGFSAETLDGDRSQIAMFAHDVNNRASGVSIASTLTLRRMAYAHLSAVGIGSSAKIVDDIYENGKASVLEYQEEVEKFSQYFHEAYEIFAFLHAIIQACEDDAKRFATLYDAGATKYQRLKEIEKLSMSTSHREREAAQTYYSKLSEIPEFRPPTRDQYLDRFVDLTDDEALNIYEEARRIARSHLEKRVN